MTIYQEEKRMLGFSLGWPETLFYGFVLMLKNISKRLFLLLLI